MINQGLMNLTWPAFTSNISICGSFVYKYSFANGTALPNWVLTYSSSTLISLMFETNNTAFIG